MLKPGLNYIISDTLTGFTASSDRLKRFVRESPYPLAFIFVYESRNLNPDLADSTLSDGRFYTCMLGSELLAKRRNEKVDLFLSILDLDYRNQEAKSVKMRKGNARL